MTGAGLNPLPVQRPIPIWIGGSSPAAYRRIGRLADGWFPMMGPGEPLDQARDQVRRAAEAAGRDLSGIGMEGRIGVKAGETEAAERRAKRWEEAGATHLEVNTMGGGFEGVDAHVAALQEVAGVLGLHP